MGSNRSVPECRTTKEQDLISSANKWYGGIVTKLQNKRDLRDVNQVVNDSNKSTGKIIFSTIMKISRTEY